MFQVDKLKESRRCYLTPPPQWFMILFCPLCSVPFFSFSFSIFFLFSFVFVFFETGFLCVALAVLELTL